MRLGRRILFFDKLIERSICDAILQQQKEEVACLREEERDKETSDLRDEEGSPGARGKVAKNSKKQMEGKDPYGLLN